MSSVFLLCLSVLLALALASIIYKEVVIDRQAEEHKQVIYAMDLVRGHLKTNGATSGF